MARNSAPARDGGEAIAEWMRGSGITAFFNVPGESFLPVLAAVEDAGFTAVTNRHESGAGFAAEAYGKLTRRPAVCMATRGPGSANLSIGVQTAHYDGTPLLALLGQVPSAHLEDRAFQGVDLTQFFSPIAKYATTVRRRSALLPALEHAHASAIRPRMGPAVVALPEDVLDVEVADTASGDFIRRSDYDTGDVHSLLTAIRGARRPAFISALPAVRGQAAADLATVGEQLGVPIFSAWRRWSSVDPDSPAFCGCLGLGSSPWIGQTLAASDLIVGFGLADEEITLSSLCRNPDQAREIVVVDRRVDAQTAPPPLPEASRLRLCNQDAGEVLAQLAASCRERVDTTPPERTLEAVREHYRSLRQQHVDSAETALMRSADDANVDMDAWALTLDRMAPDDAIVVSDAGNFSQWLVKHVSFRNGRVYLGPVNGAMGYGLPGAIGASVARPESSIWAICGDGGLAMTLGDLETVARLNSNVAVVVVNNGVFGSIKAHQEGRYGIGHSQASDLGPIDFARVAEGFGWTALTVERSDDLGDAFASIAQSTGPRLLQVLPSLRPLSAQTGA